MRTEARFPAISVGSGHYESFYVKATRPGGGRGVWIRHTVHKRPGEELTGSIWFTLFDADAAGPRATKVTVPAAEVAAPTGAFISVGGAVLEPGAARGEVSTPELEASWDLRFEAGPEAFRHLPYGFLYNAPLPKTKFLSPYPDARFTGEVTVAGERLELEAWPGMIGHNWGAEHAERWTWIQANEFDGHPGYFDAALGRIKVGGMTTPWVGNAMLHVDGEAHRLGGFDRIRSTRIADQPTRCDFELGGKGVRVRGRVSLRAAELRRLGLRRPGRARAQHSQLLDLRPRADRRAPRARGAAAALRGRGGIRDRDARDGPRRPGPAVSGRLNALSRP